MHDSTIFKLLALIMGNVAILGLIVSINQAITHVDIVQCGVLFIATLGSFFWTSYFYYRGCKAKQHFK